jgi:hypothetical protein
MQILSDAESQLINAGHCKIKNKPGKSGGKNNVFDISQINLAINVALNGGIINNTQINYATVNSLG